MLAAAAMAASKVATKAGWEPLDSPGAASAAAAESATPDLGGGISSPADRGPGAEQAASSAPPSAQLSELGPWESYDEHVRGEIELLREQLRDHPMGAGTRAERDARCEAIAGPMPHELFRQKLPVHVWVWCRVLIGGDRVSRAHVLEQLKATYGRAEVGRLVSMAFELHEDGWRYGWGDVCGRRALARVVAIRTCMRVVRRRDVQGSPARDHVLAAYRMPQRLFLRLLCDTDGRQWTRRTHSRDATRLDRLGMTVVRPPADRVPRNEVGPSGQNVNRYMLNRLRSRTLRHASRIGSRKSRAPEAVGSVMGVDGTRSLQVAQWCEIAEISILQRLPRRPRRRRCNTIAPAMPPPD